MVQLCFAVPELREMIDERPSGDSCALKRGSLRKANYSRCPSILRLKPYR